jgi:opacity protein-like surface antigen
LDFRPPHPQLRGLIEAWPAGTFPPWHHHNKWHLIPEIAAIFFYESPSVRILTLACVFFSDVNMMKTTTALLGTTLAVGLALAGGSTFAAGMPNGTMMAPASTMAAMQDSGLYVSVFAGAAFGQAVTARSETKVGNFALYGTDYNIPVRTGYLIGAALGMHLAPDLRGEVELSYAAHELSDTASTTYFVNGVPGTPQTTRVSGSTKALYLLGNLWYDIDTGTQFTPYFGGGLGVAKLTTTLNNSYRPLVASDVFAPAVQLGAGIKYEIANNIGLDLGYRAKITWKSPTGGVNTGTYLTNKTNIEQTVQIGLTFGL